jgi:hypothetical protein
MPLKHTVLLFSLLGWMSQLAAQKKAPPIPLSKAWFIRANPLGVIDLGDQNISTGTEYRFSKKWAVGIDLAYIFYSTMPDMKRTNGYIIRPAVRRYLGKGLTTYLEAELHYKYVAYNLQGWVGYGVVNNVAAWEEYRSFNFIKRVAGIQFKIGIQEKLVKDWLWIEPYIGIGARRKWQDQGLPDNATYSVQRGWTRDRVSPKVTDYIALPAGIRLLFKLR